VEFKKLDLKTARKLADKWVRLLERCCCDRVDVVAGVYRGKPEPRDIDLTCLPKDRGLLKKLGSEKSDAIREIFFDKGRKVEVWVTDRQNYDLITWFRRKSRGDYIRLATVAKSRNMKLSWREGLLDDKGNLITKDPKRIEEILS